MIATGVRSQNHPDATPDLRPAPLFTPTRKAARRFLEFFTAQINNAHTRRAYLNATRRFAEWCASKDIHELAQVEPFHVAAFVHDLQDELSPPSVKQHLAAIRMLFDWLVTGHVIETNPAHSVRGPRYTVKKGKTPVLTAEEAHALLESIPITKKPANDTEAADQPDLLGLRDRALIAIMVYSFAGIGAVIQMKVGDYFVQGRRRWVRLHEKGGKEHDVQCPGTEASGRATVRPDPSLLRSTSYMLIGPTSIATRHTSSLKCLPAENLCTSSMTSRHS